MKTIYLSAAFALLTVPAMAATVSVSGFSKTAYDSAMAPTARSATQNFEGYGEGNIQNGFATNVGTFAALGGRGTGATVRRAGFENDGALLAMRHGNVYGRTSTTSTLTGNTTDDMFLDSNDTHGILWNVMLAGQKMFDRIVFTITDAAEFGNTMQIGVDGQAGALVQSSGGGKKRLVEIDFGKSVSEAVITLSHFKGSKTHANDGFSLDDIAISVVPLPAPALLLVAGLGGLAALRRRKTTV